jgi:hypothetical protein
MCQADKVRVYGRRTALVYIESHLCTAFAQTVDLLGLWPLRAPLLSCMVTPVLYLGPLYALFLDRALPGQSAWSYAGSVRPMFGSWVAIRNYWVVR